MAGGGVRADAHTATAEGRVQPPFSGHPLKAVTLTQPWATAIALRLKRYETRSWGTSYRGPLAIHASREVDQDFVRAARAAGMPVPEAFPTGAIVAVVNLGDCVRGVPDLSDIEAFWGNFDPGRFFWRLDLVIPLVKPIPCRGSLGLWNVPADVLQAVHAAVMTGPIT